MQPYNVITDPFDRGAEFEVFHGFYDAAVTGRQFRHDGPREVGVIVECTAHIPGGHQQQF